MEITEKVKSVLSELSSDATLGIAVSGGSDSVCLASVIINEKLWDPSKLLIVNAEHGIRGETSLRDTAFVTEYAALHGINISVKHLNVPAAAEITGRSIETEARILRHEYFNELLGSGRIDYILIAHNAHDRTESILMHIFRGCGIGGLVGIREYDGKIVRPLLGCTKDEILGYLDKHNQKYVTDESNSDNSYSRNFLRNRIMPLIKEKWPGIDDTLSNLSEIALNSLDDSVSGNTVSLDGITGDKVKRAFINAGLTHDFTKKNIDNVLALGKSISGAKTDLPHGYEAVRVYGSIEIRKKEEKSNNEYPYDGRNADICGKTVISEKADLSKADLKRSTIIDMDKIPSGAVLRTRRDGDTFKSVNGKSKLLSDYMAERKIPVTERNNIIVLACGNVIYCVVGQAVGEQAKVDKNTVNAVNIHF